MNATKMPESGPVLKSYVAGQWRGGEGKGHSLVNPTDGSVVASCSTEGVDFAGTLTFAREAGGPALRALTFAERASLLGKIAAFKAHPLKLLDADVEKGAFVGPALLMVTSGEDYQLANELEVFGPVASLMPYRDKRDAVSIAARGGGSLAASVFSADDEFLSEAAMELAPSHGRVLLVDPSIGNSHSGHGIVMPSCVHGGPGRAGGRRRGARCAARLVVLPPKGCHSGLWARVGGHYTSRNKRSGNIEVRLPKVDSS